MSERRMDAYYYDFEPTKNAAVDKILGAVACAGKAYHHTQDWCDETSPYDDHTGETPIEWIQNAAIEAADEIDRLQKENERLRAALEGLLDVQNGAPLLRNQSEYDMAVEAARAALKDGESDE